MELREGYKKTELGVIPVEWDIKSLEEMTVLMTNGFVGAAKRHYVENGLGVLYIQGFNVQESSFNFQGIKRVNIDFHKKNMKSCLQKDDLLTVQTGDVGLTTIVPKELEGSNCHALIISRFMKEKYLPKFYCFYFNSHIGKARLKEIETGTIMKHINVGILKYFLVPTPPLLEQQAIASALSDIDSLISSLTKLIDKKKNIKEGAMQELLTGMKRLEGFSGEWEEKSINEIGKLTGAGVDKKIIEGQTPVILLNYLDVYKRVAISRKILNHEVTATEEKLKSCNVQKGDIFFTPTSETSDDIAKSAVAIEDMEDVVYSYHVLRLRPYEHYDSLFLNYAFKAIHFEKQANTFSEGSGTRYVITLKKFRELSVIIPKNIEEQTAIANILSDMDSEIEALEEKLDKYRAIKQGMMEELLTGRVRLI